jgi:hypothetical protein
MKIKKLQIDNPARPQEILSPIRQRAQTSLSPNKTT